MRRLLNCCLSRALKACWLCPECPDHPDNLYLRFHANDVMTGDSHCCGASYASDIDLCCKLKYAGHCGWLGVLGWQFATGSDSVTAEVGPLPGNGWSWTVAVLAKDGCPIGDYDGSIVGTLTEVCYYFDGEGNEIRGECLHTVTFTEMSISTTPCL